MKQSNQWYSIILAVLMVWFMLVLTHWVLTLVIGESRDTKAIENYLKAYAWAEWALELGMMEAKLENYGVDTENTDFSQTLHNNGWNNKDVSIEYQIQGLVNSLEDREIWAWAFAIIPMFWKGTEVKRPRLNFVWSGGDQVVWNILSESSGLAGLGEFSSETLSTQKTITNGNVNINTNKKVSDFLDNNTKNYLILHNTGDTSVAFTLTSNNLSEKFTNTTVKIVGTGEVWGWKQNIFVDIDTQNYLNLLKYSVFSPD